MNSRLLLAAQNNARMRTERMTGDSLRMQTAPSQNLRPSPTADSPQYSTKLDRRVQMGMALFILMFLTFTAGYWQMYGSPLSMFKVANQTPQTSAIMHIIDNRSINRRLVIGGIHLGMTPEMVKRMYPTAKRLKDRQGTPAMSIATSRGSMVLWLYDDSRNVLVNGDIVHQKRERVFRMRIDETFSRLDEKDLMALYGQFYGRPIEATCNRSQLGDTPRCTYRWWGGNGIELTAILKQKVDASGAPYTLLTTIATNTKQAAHQASAVRRGSNTQSPS